MLLKLLITGVIAAIAVAVLLANSSADNAGPDWLWQGSKRDPLRRLVFRDDGSLRRSAKASIVVWLLVFILIVWFVLPSTNS
jgi:hypothetical protein